MKILLANPANAGILRAVGVHFPPMGLLYLGAYLEREGSEVAIRDFCNPGERPDYSRYDLVGISADTTRHLKAMGIARRAQETGSAPAHLLHAHGMVALEGQLHLYAFQKGRAGRVAIGKAA
jgi:hypothetical protein